MENQLLTDSEMFPDNAVLQAVLGKKFALYEEFVKQLGEKNIVPEWHYYNDGKSWLGKTMYKKKNIAWVSVWDTGFKITFFFTEKTLSGFYALEISDEIKQEAKKQKNLGKLIPVLLLISGKKVLKDAMRIFEYKMGLK